MLREGTSDEEVEDFRLIGRGGSGSFREMRLADALVLCACEGQVFFKLRNLR